MLAVLLQLINQVIEAVQNAIDPHPFEFRKQGHPEVNVGNSE